MARQSKKAREIRLVAQAHREAEERLRRVYRELWQASWPLKEKRERCEDGKESSLICPGIDGAPRTGGDD
ncbi:MAG: hypothetical protein PVG97_11575 [Syntrophobacterales bacterium]|jgi:hypothetical protein